jgi:hypothetical protein
MDLPVFNNNKEGYTRSDKGDIGELHYQSLFFTILVTHHYDSQERREISLLY